jgi:tetratricopeptide (TPR) repeat protein
MGNDYRPDHSFRVPDPRLAAATDSPDACLRCHVDEDAAWSQAKVEEWYGPGHVSHYGEVLFRGRRGEAGADAELAALAADALYPVNVRATAVSLLGTNFPGEIADRALQAALLDEEPLLRRTAVANLQLPEARAQARVLARTLHDPVRAVRIEAASRLTAGLVSYLDIPQKERFDAVLEEYTAAMRYSADFAFGRYNLGNLYNNLGQPDQAIEEYERAVRIDSNFYPAKANLALLYNQRGDNVGAERLLREVVEAQPELYDMTYSLGLLLVEMQRADEALTFLARASEGLPERARIHYNLGLLYQQTGDIQRAEHKLLQAARLEPANLDFLYGLADHYIKRGMFDRAIPVVEAMIATHPENPIGMQMMGFIRQALGTQ